MNKKFQLLLFIGMLILNVGASFAQTTTGAISGTVTDGQQAVVACRNRNGA